MFAAHLVATKSETKTHRAIHNSARQIIAIVQLGGSVRMKQNNETKNTHDKTCVRASRERHVCREQPVLFSYVSPRSKFRSFFFIPRVSSAKSTTTCDIGTSITFFFMFLFFPTYFNNVRYPSVIF